jgi:hypothetical protein
LRQNKSVSGYSKKNNRLQMYFRWQNENVSGYSKKITAYKAILKRFTFRAGEKGVKKARARRFGRKKGERTGVG